ncbi:hypothetical protein ACIRPK_26640 [Kitasatospora sp. NPDC101801]
MTGPTLVTPNTDHVSARAAKALRAAMERLLAGRPTRTDGRLMKENLYKEADVSRATMNRAHGILAEWDQRTAASGARTPGEARREDELQLLRIELKSLKRQRSQLQCRLDAAATVIAALHLDNQALREHLESRTDSVVALDAARQQ